jgi:uncharacterized protein
VIATEAMLAPRRWLLRAMTALRGLALLLLVALACLPGAALADGQHTFWEVTGQHNKVWLLGSVHVLHDSDTALPAVATTAYAGAETVIEELDLNAAIGEMASTGAAMQMLPDGKTLRGVLGPGLYAQLEKEARKLSLDLDFMTRFAPWAVALQIEQMRLLRAGYNPLNGVDFQIATWAQRDGKPLHGLETLEDQLGLFSHLSLDEQSDFLRSMLEEEDSQKQLGDITRAWRDGYLRVLESLLRQGSEESPELFKKLTVDRNRRWLPQIEKMLQDPRNDYLVVTGALHMVGSDGLVQLLRSKGYRVEQK